MENALNRARYNGNELVSPDSTAQLLGVSKETLRWWRYRRTSLPWVVVGGRRVMYRRSDIDAFIEQGVVNPQGVAHGC